LEWVEKSLPVLREIGPTAYPDLVWTLWDYSSAVSYLFQDNDRTIGAIDESIQISRQMGSAGAWYLGMSLYVKSQHSFDDREIFLQLVLESKQAFTQSGDRWSVMMPLHQLGLNCEIGKDFDQALRYYEEAGCLAEEVGDQPSLSYIDIHLGRLHRKMGNIEMALQYHMSYIQLWATMGNQEAMKEGFVNLGLDWFCLGNSQIDTVQKESHRQAILLISVAEKQRSLAYNFLLDPDLYDQAIETCRHEWGEEEYKRVWEQGQAMMLEEAITLAQVEPINKFNSFNRRFSWHTLPVPFIRKP
jgi:tetratricopeptide (TPR) repeat protein